MSYILTSITGEHNKYNQILHQLSIFPQINSTDITELSHIIVFFRFRPISFSKKRALAFFLALELLTHHKCVASLSSRNIQTWKIRKGRLVGCKVTLRKESKFDFIGLIGLAFPRIEKRRPSVGIIGNKAAKNSNISKRGPTLSVNSTFSLKLSELILFYPIELGLGLHPDVRDVIVNLIFSSVSVEERYFFLRQAKIPVRH